MARNPRTRSPISEFLVVMLGVLVALGLEQVLLDWRDRQRVGDTLLAMNEELADFTGVFDIRLQAAPCISGKLDAIDAWLASTETTLPPVINIGQPPFFFSSRGGWNGGSAELLARHRSPETARIYGEVYQGMEEFGYLAQREQAYWSQLQALKGHGGPLDADLRWRAAEAAAGARSTGRLLAVIAEQMLERVDTLVPGAESTMSGFTLKDRPICLPLAAKPAEARPNIKG